jgi:hypothetical protein
MKMTSNDALAKIRALNLAGSAPVEKSLADASLEHPPPAAEPSSATLVAQKQRNDKKPKKNPETENNLRKRSHSKGNAATIITGYIDQIHIDVLRDLRARSGIDSLSGPSANLLLRVALRLLKTLRPSNDQVLSAFAEEQSEE